MLSPADEALCARDPALPGLAAVLDADGLLNGIGLAGLQPGYVRYKPGTSCVVGLTPANGDLAAFAAMAYPAGRYAEVRARTKWRTGAQPAIFVDRLQTVIVPLVHDRRLKAARNFGSPERRHAFLARFGLENAALSLLRYKPGRRLVLRADGPSGPRGLIKVHAQAAFAPAAAGAHHAARVAGAPLTGLDEGAASVASEWIAGVTLAGASGSAAYRATGAELARLHLAAPRAGGLARAREVRTSTTALTALLPDLAGKALQLAARLDHALSWTVGTGPACIIHGDFTADQVLLRGAKPVVIDWDRMRIGDPAQDLGSFLARLDADVIAGSLSAGAAEEAAAAFLDGYAAVAGAVPEAVDAHRAEALFGIAGEGFRTRRAYWADEARAALDRVSEHLSARGPKRPEPTRGLSAALDPDVIGPQIGAVADAPPEIALLRHKAGRRALIRYDVAGRPPMLGKLRAKGPDRRTPRLHRALRDAGLDGRPPLRVGVPELLGEIDSPALWLQALVPGRCLGEMLFALRPTGPARLAGRALGVLHGRDMPSGRTWSMSDELDVLGTAFAEIADPAVRSRADRLVLFARDALAGLPAVPATGIHRDFHPDQVLIDGDTVWLVDLDLFARGDPLLDVGNFLAHLAELGLRLHGHADVFRAEAEAFLSGYEGVRGRCERGRLAVLEWVSLARHVALSRRLSGRQHTTQSILAVCEEGPGGFSRVMEPPSPLNRAQ